MHPTLAQAFPAIAAQIDADRVLLARPIAEHTTCEWSEKEIILHCDDDATYQLLTTPSQAAYLRTAFSLPIHAMRHLPVDDDTPPIDPPINTAPAVNDVTPSSPPPSRTRTMLTLPQRAQLLAWVEAHRAEAATTPDATLATQASEDLLFSINASHVRTIRDALSIAKTKPEPRPELSLAELQARLNAHEQRLDDHALEATGMKATIAALHDRLRTLLTLHNYNAAPGCSIPELPPLSQSGQ
jgi:hypothetical protein